MKNRIIIALALISAAACTRMEEFQETFLPEYNGVPMTFSASFDEKNTRTVLQSDGSVFWNPGDSIVVFPLSDTVSAGCCFTTDITKPSLYANFSGICTTAPRYLALYPYLKDASASKGMVRITVPAVQNAVAGSFDPKAFPSVALTDTSVLYFRNVCGGAKMKFTRSDITSVEFRARGGEALCGSVSASMVSGMPYIKTLSTKSSVTLLGPDGGCFDKGVVYCISLLPISLDSGFDIVYHTANSSAVYEYGDTVTIHRSVFGRLYDLDKNLKFTSGEGTDLSAAGTANCYIVNAAGTYKFKGTVKGGSTESLDGIPVSADVLWESFGTGTTPSVGDIVKSVSYSDGYVKFSTPSTLNNGNAVIAVKDASGNILWSWHIWVCKGFDAEKTAQVYNNNAGTMMDRNLGATSATPGDVHALGLLYQWGRKDPFLSSSSISSSSVAASTLSWPGTVSSSSSTGTNAYAVAHPTTFITYNKSNYDWYYTGSSSTDDTRWQTSDKDKGMYDPCPAGWRVPDGGSSGVWSTAFGSSSSYSTGPWDSTNKGMNFGSGNGKSSSMQLGSASTIWYSVAGYRSNLDGALRGVGYYGYSWSCSPNGYSAFCLNFNYDGYVAPSGNSNRAGGQSVRCIKEGTYPSPEPEYEDLSSSGTANCYVVNTAGNYKFKGTVKGGSTESLGTPASAEVLWESFGTDVTPSVGDIVKSVSYSDGYVKFSTPSTLNNGNAVIAVKDASGNILWSWHIWVCKGFDAEKTAQVYNNNAGTMMDRNLGATSATPGDVHALGLLYQWGRKDPFLSSSSISSNSVAASTISWPGTVSSSSSTGTNAYAVAHPTTFITYNSNNYDWYYTGSKSTDDTRWQTSDKDKGMYDPCPAGWRVPDGGSSGVWSTAFGSSSSYSTGPWDSKNKGMNFGSGNGKSSSMQLGSASTIWYPAAGYRVGVGGTLHNVGYRGSYWSSTPGGYRAYYLDFNYSGNVYPSYDYDRAGGQSLRCLSE